MTTHKSKGLEEEKEGGARCNKCISFRMENVCKYAKENGYDFFTTTLSGAPQFLYDFCNCSISLSA